VEQGILFLTGIHDYRIIDLKMLFSKCIGSIIRVFSWLYYEFFALFRNINSVCSAFVQKKECSAASTNLEKRKSTIPRSVNYHFTRQCNYECGFCFHTAKTSFVLPIDAAKRGLRLLRDAGETQHIASNIQIQTIL
jgi:hypothetical protein